MTNRIFGLDFLRAAAILMVLLANTIFFFQLQLPALSDLAPITGFLGLEIFLVLSGFLLGRSFYPIFMTPSFGLSDCVRFVRRRLWRIVPLYFLIVIANIAIAAAMDYPFDHAWKYFFFLQNFSTPIPAFFPESWGLPVIVMAMLLFVALLYGMAKATSQKYKSVVFALGALILLLIFIWTKWLYDSIHTAIDLTDWETTLRTVVIYRIDAVMIGVLFGTWSINGSASFSKLRRILVAVGLVGLAFLTFGVGFLQLSISEYPMFWNVFYLPLSSLTIACFFPLLANWTAGPAALRFIRVLSNAAFAIYLTHFSIVLLLLEHFLMRDASVGNSLAFLAIGYFILAIVVGTLVHFFVEKRVSTIAKR